MSRERQLPNGWAWTSIGDIGAIQGGIQKQPSRAPRRNAFPYLRVANVLRGRLDLREVERMELFDGELDALRLLPGDLLVVEGNGSPNEIGRSALWRGEIENCVHQNHIIRVRFLAGEPAFLDYYWNSSEGSAQVTSVASSTSGLHTLSMGKVSRIRVPIAPLAEQCRIVAAIEQQFTRLDAGIAALNRAQANLKRYRAAVLKAAVEGALTAEWRAAHPNAEPASVLLARILAERRGRWEADQHAKGNDPARLRYAEPAAPDTSALPSLPEGWVWATVEQLVSRSEYGTSVKCTYEALGMPVLRIPNIAGGEIDLADLKCATEHR
jgi:type I restriction enzyme, S subunit